MANLNIRMDENLKTEAEKVLSRLGLTASEAVRIFFSQIRNTQSIPFELKLYDEPGPAAVRAVAEAEEDIKAGRISGAYHNSDDLMKALLEE